MCPIPSFYTSVSLLQFLGTLTKPFQGSSLSFLCCWLMIPSKRLMLSTLRINTYHNNSMSFHCKSLTIFLKSRVLWVPRLLARQKPSPGLAATSPMLLLLLVRISSESTGRYLEKGRNRGLETGLSSTHNTKKYNSCQTVQGNFQCHSCLHEVTIEKISNWEGGKLFWAELRRGAGLGRRKLTRPSL